MIQPLLIKGGRIIDPSQGIDHSGNILIKDGTIAWLLRDEGQETCLPEHCLVLDAHRLVVCPGFIDLHCHLREPGFEEKETIATGTEAAARGGFTTVCCMPNTNPPIDNKAVVDYVKDKARKRGIIRVLPIGCISKGRRGEELAEMGELAQAGVVAYSDDSDPVRDSRLMRHALEYSRNFGLPIIDHCEDTTLTEDGVMNEGWVATRLGLRGMPTIAEEIMVARDIALAELTKGRLHIAHVSTRGSVELIRRAKEKGVAITAEVTPHHLTLTEERVMGNEAAPQPLSLLSYDTNAKVKPPLRTRREIEALILGLKEGVIDAIATDHAPHTEVDKRCEFGLAAFGISGLETALGALMGLVHSGELDLPLLISKLTIEPARIIGKEIGTLRMGAPGDVTIFDPEAEWVVDPKAFASKGKNTPLAGRILKGRVMATVCGGKIVFQDKHLRLEKSHDIKERVRE